MNAAATGAEWFRHYGFDRDPFAEGGVHGLFYPGGARQDVVEQLQHLARFSDCVLLVTGQAGAGKSATRRHFVAQCAADVRCCVVEAALLDGPEQWLRRVLAGFGLRAADQPDLALDLRTLAAHCASQQAAGTRCWLVVDDAQDLHADVAAMLPRLLGDVGPALRTVFFAEPAWRESLQSALPVGAGLHTLELQPFEPGETYAYIHYRLNTAGLDGEPPFNAQEYQRIHQQSGGWPGRINTQAREVLSAAVVQVQQPLSTLPLWHFLVIGATLGALLLLYAWGSVFKSAPPAAPVPVAKETAATGAGTQAEVPSLQIAPADETTGHADAGAALPGDATSLELADQAATEPAPPDEPAPAEPATADAGEATTGPVLVPPPPPSAAPEPATQDLAATPPPAPAPAAPVAASPARIEATAKVEQPPASPAKTAKPPAASSRADTGADEEWLLALAADRWVLQLMGSDSEPRLRTIAARIGVESRMYRKLNKGQPWYALVHGNYASSAEATAAIAGLPDALRGAGPWVRRVDGVQKEIRAARTR